MDLVSFPRRFSGSVQVEKMNVRCVQSSNTKVQTKRKQTIGFIYGQGFVRHESQKVKEAKGLPSNKTVVKQMGHGLQAAQVGREGRRKEASSENRF